MRRLATCIRRRAHREDDPLNTFRDTDGYYRSTLTRTRKMATKIHMQAYRVAVAGDEAGILKVFAEVASEVPTAVRPQTEAYIKRFVASGQSWVATDADAKIIGYALTEKAADTISLVY